MKLIVPVLSALILSAASAAASAAVSTNLIGESVVADAAQRTVAIDASTRWVNVTQGETVKFVANGNEFTFDFDGVSGYVDLAQIAPAGALDHKVAVYVARQPVSGGM
jgi:hypothetical protein